MDTKTFVLTQLHDKQLTPESVKNCVFEVQDEWDPLVKYSKEEFFVAIGTIDTSSVKIDKAVPYVWDPDGVGERGEVGPQYGWINASDEVYGNEYLSAAPGPSVIACWPVPAPPSIIVRYTKALLKEMAEHKSVELIELVRSRKLSRVEINHAAEYLGVYCDESFDLLVELLQDEDPIIREGGLFGLKEFYYRGVKQDEIRSVVAKLYVQELNDSVRLAAEDILN